MHRLGNLEQVLAHGRSEFEIAQSAHLPGQMYDQIAVGGRVVDRLVQHRTDVRLEAILKYGGLIDRIIQPVRHERERSAILGDRLTQIGLVAAERHRRIMGVIPPPKRR